MKKKAVLLSALLCLAGCGAKTGLLIDPFDADVDDGDVQPEADVEEDADVESDVDVCVAEPIELDRARAEVIFVIDRSTSMQWELIGTPGVPGDPSRWELLRDALEGALDGVDHLLEVGGKFFPQEVVPEDGPDVSCLVEEGLELRPRENNAANLLRFFRTTSPEGGTPTASALIEVHAHLESETPSDIPRFVVLATDGGPNCNLDFSPDEECVCTGPDEYCSEGVGGTFNCLDSNRTLSVINDIATDLGVPVFVIGIDDPSRPDLADFLDEMAIAGLRPRPEPAERRFYSVQRPGELDQALEIVTESIALCVFYVEDTGIAADPRTEIILDGELIDHDPSRSEGWDWTDEERGEITLFGEVCDQVNLPGSRIEARLGCEGHDW